MILILMLAAAWRLRRREKIISFCIVWYFVTTSVEAMSVCFIHGGVMYDHFLYLPMVGMSFLLVYNIERWVRPERLRLTLRVVLILIYGMLTIHRNIVWQSPVLIWTEVVAQDPQDDWPYDFLARAYKEDKDYDHAIAAYEMFFKKSIPTSKERLASMMVSLSALYGLKGMFDEELQYAREALRLDPYQDQAYNNIGLVFAMKGDFETAYAHFQQAIVLNPNNVQAYTNIGVLNLKLGHLDEARVLFKQALEINPADETARQYFRQIFSLNARDLHERFLSSIFIF
jgi:tetratricopeptide (TPR) repeat protein